ncbi:MAG: nitrilase [Alphaproteobacteria bacterium]|nr:nitrilase [Alphaproteobacteria bacterium]
MTDKLLGPGYYAIALQTTIDGVNGCGDREAAFDLIHKSITRLAGEISSSKKFVGPDVRLMVLPEYVLTAYPMGESIEGWANKACLDMDGPEYDMLGRIAQDNDLYLSGNAYEKDPNFPGLYFQASFIIDPSGDVILRYRRLNSVFAPTPHDVWDKYLDIYGLDGVFPVAKTDIGNLACIASEEILYPEIARSLALRGAEVFLHSSGEIACTHDSMKNIARKARAMENMAYVISSNCAGIRGHAMPENATGGKSAIIDYRGMTLQESGWGDTMTANDHIDLNALRRHRARPAMNNFLARQRLELFADTYSGPGSHPANSLLDKNGDHIVPERSHFLEVMLKAIGKV